MIELRQVSKSYAVGRAAVHAVRPLDLAIPDGQFVSVVGHSGSGKSTLLSLIGGLARPDAGTVTVDGVDVWSFDDRARSRLRNERFGFIYQFASLLPTLTAVENVLLPTAFGAPRPEADAVRLLERVGLGDKAGRYPSQLSGGEQQRVAIARAFVNQPRIVLADEPTGELDEETEASIMTFLQGVNRDQGVTIVMVTHSSELAVRAGRRLRMKDGFLEEVR
jgi:putative ABC transport system ATP-binding protein/lipoprotein-releasing system ATP-binding protein